MIRQITVSALTMLVLDATYLYYLGGPRFARMIKSIQNSKLNLNLYGAITSYVFLLFGLHYFVLSRKKASGTLPNLVHDVAVIRDAALFGLVVYGVFDSTNIALFSKYETGPAIADTLWGAVLMAVTAFMVRATVP